ncbi:N-acetylmuramic acid 6-phosphate etherase [Longimonas halophila]|uniref:N-acetylmuramic acid 6-phosphate etherase n=1 Tax=Longimonas halophila TaxID=1469170 RepID=A0A2H3NPB0_9BACT|nr:N-acetylmuramic acid 6-phosphate etherase [Longimonas halophila]PEN08790.1 N-acetylmuramic acid 6-phosphate etherase [Longimonas halophila]
MPASSSPNASPSDEASLSDDLKTRATEQRNPHSQHIDTASTHEILEIISTEDHRVPIAVRRELPRIAEAVDAIVDAFEAGGRLLYVGAGTSGRLGVLDASECPPTFGTDPEQVQGLIAGGREAVFRSQEGAEDQPEDGAQALREINCTARDVVCGIAASGRTPFVGGALDYARELGGTTVYVACTPPDTLNAEVDVAICPIVGPEVIMGSTRMKSGTAQKMVLNMLTTASMIRRGTVYENMMVDLQRTSTKLVERARRTLMMAADTDYATAERTLQDANGHVKTALVMLLGEVPLDTATRLLDASDGFARPAIQEALALR